MSEHKQFGLELFWQEVVQVRWSVIHQTQTGCDLRQTGKLLPIALRKMWSFKVRARRHRPFSRLYYGTGWPRWWSSVPVGRDRPEGSRSASQRSPERVTFWKWRIETNPAQPSHGMATG